MGNRDNKKERRRARHERNIKKEIDYKEKVWKEGKKLIEPNHNNGPYPSDYSIELGKRLYERIQNCKKISLGHLNNLGECDEAEYFVEKFRLYKIKIRDFILHFNPDIPKTKEYEYLKKAIELYWDEPEKMYYKL